MPVHRVFSVSKTSRLLLALCTLACLFVGGRNILAFAGSPVVVGAKAVVTNTDGDPIRVRQGAGTEFAQVATAYEGQVVSVLAGPGTDKTGKLWFEVQAPGGKGWISADYLQGTGPAPSSDKIASHATVANTNGDSLRLRDSPSTTGTVLKLLDPGATVTILAGPLTDQTGIAWYQVTMVAAPGLTGWAMAQYLVPAAAVVADPPTATLTPVIQPKPTATVQPTATRKPATQSKPAAVASPSPTQKPKTKPSPTQKPPLAATPISPAVAVSAPSATPVTGAATGTLSTMEQYKQWMVEARAMYPYKETVDKMWSVMMCESGGNARISGAGGAHVGLFQYAPATWSGSWNPYRQNSILDAKSQIFATAKAWSIGMQSAWTCYYMR